MQQTFASSEKNMWHNRSGVGIVNSFCHMRFWQHADLIRAWLAANGDLIHSTSADRTCSSTRARVLQNGSAVHAVLWRLHSTASYPGGSEAILGRAGVNCFSNLIFSHVWIATKVTMACTIFEFSFS
jgi:hypothetical protein